MLLGIVLFVLWMALEAVVVIGSVIWSIENDEWKNIERPKYAMMNNLEPADWPGREPLTKWEPKKNKKETGQPI